MIAARQNYKAGLILVSVAAIAWSLSGLFTRLIAADTPTILFWRGLYGAAGLVLTLMFVPATGGLRSFRNLGKPGFAYAAITSLSMLLFIGALRQTTVAHVAVITATVPFFAAYLGWAILRERPSRPAIVASSVALVGVAIMSGVGLEGNLFGDTLALLMAFCMAGMILISRRYRDIPALTATCTASALTALATIPFATFASVTSFDLSILLIFALVNQVMGFGFFALGARYLPPMESALITALDAPLAPLWVWTAFAETPTLATILGGMLVLVAVIANIWWTSR